MEEARDFCRLLLEHVPDDLWALLWTMPDKRSTWVPLEGGVDAVAEEAGALADGHDVYIAVSVAERRGDHKHRITSSNSAGIMGLWADVDVADPDIHKKWNLPPNENSALELLDAVGLEPTLLVHSGHGLQAWWLFNEFWAFDNEAERIEASRLAERWNATLRVRAAERGWTVDSTFDLARVMRVPGTWNRKGHPHVPVRLLKNTGKRYASDDFNDHVVDDEVLRKQGATPTRVYVVDDLALRENAEPPFQKFQALDALEPKFSDSWNRRRRDLSDQSPSAYDMSLASFAASAGWADQEIADLLIASRRKHGDDLKLRHDYYSRTISRARERHARDKAADEMEDVVDELKDAKVSGDDEEVKHRRRATMDALSNQLGIEILHFVKYLADPPSYSMVTPTQEIHIGAISSILTQQKLREAVAQATGHIIDRFSRQSWDRISQAILDACEDQDTGMEATEAGLVYVWLTEYLLARPPVTDAEEAVLSGHPITDEHGVHIFGASLRHWLWVARGERVSSRELGRMLRAYGCAPSRLNIMVEGSRSTRSAWTLPRASEWERWGESEGASHDDE